MAGIELNGAYDENAKAQDFELIPAGEYKAQIIQAEKADISRNNNYGECLILTWVVMGGAYEGRLIWQRLNLWGVNMNNNDKVVFIANSQFAAIREATGKLTPRDTDELLYIPCLIKVAITQDKDKQYNPRNEVKGAKALDGSGGANGARPTGEANHTPPSGGTPWGVSGGTAATSDDVPF